MCIRDRPDAAVGGGGGKARYVQKRPASHGNDVGMAVDARFHNVAEGLFPRGNAGFGRFPARNGTAAGKMGIRDRCRTCKE